MARGQQTHATERCIVVGIPTLALHRLTGGYQEAGEKATTRGLKRSEKLTRPGHGGRCAHRGSMQGSGRDNRNGRQNTARQFVVVFGASRSFVAIAFARGRKAFGADPFFQPSINLAENARP